MSFSSSDCGLTASNLSELLSHSVWALVAIHAFRLTLHAGWLIPDWLAKWKQLFRDDDRDTRRSS
jgi:hypothetical protein